MSDQISGEWYTRRIGLPGAIPERNLRAAVGSIMKYNCGRAYIPEARSERGRIEPGGPAGRPLSGPQS